MSTPTLPPFAVWLRGLRGHLGETRRAFGERLGFPDLNRAQRVYTYESGRAGPSTILRTLLARIAADEGYHPPPDPE